MRGMLLVQLGQVQQQAMQVQMWWVQGQWWVQRQEQLLLLELELDQQQ